MRTRLLLLAIAMSATALPVTMITPSAVHAAGCQAPAPLPTTQPAAEPSGFHAIAPVRLLDTRDVGVKVGAGCTIVLDLAATGPAQAIPSDAEAVALNVTTVDAALRGYVTVYPCGSSRPNASNVNPRTAGATANSALVQVDSTRTICLYSLTSLHLIVDATGWFGRFGAPYHAVDGARLLDTRTALRPDGLTGPLAARTELRLPVVGGSISDDARAVAINVTITDATLEGFVTVYPCSSQRPPTSTVNFLPNEERANHTVLGLDVDGSVCIWSNVSLHVIVDIEGWFGGPLGSGTQFQPMLGSRVLDTRDGTGGITGKVDVGKTVRFDPSDKARLPLGSTVVLSAITTETDVRGFITLFPCSADQPPTSAVNSVVGTESTNVAFVTVDATSQVCLYVSNPTHVVIDVIGTFGPGGPLHQLSIGSRTLGQPFTPDAHDYTTICSTGLNSFTVHAVGAPGTTVSIAAATEPAPPRDASVADRTLTLNENEAVVVRAGTPGGNVQEYWVRCLPHDFPIIRVDRTEAPHKGWYLLDTAFPTGPGDQTRFLMILDQRSVPVWYRRVANPSIDLTLLSDGTLAWTKLQGLAFGSDPTGAYEVHTLDGTLVRTIKTVSGPTDHHDIAELPNGNVVLATYVARHHVDLTALGAGYTNDELVYDSHLEEIRPDGTVAWTWKSEDHIPITDSTFAQRLPGIDGLGVDLIHVNSVHVAPDGDLIVSARHTDTVYKIRRNPAGDVVWRLGGKHSDFTFVNDPLNGIARQHDAQLLADGHVRLFDNRTALGAPRAVEYALDTTAKTATLLWSITDPDVPASGGVGSVRTIGDGDHVVTWGGSSQPAFGEFDPDGNELQATTLVGRYAYRVDKQSVAAFDINVLRATAGR